MTIFINPQIVWEMDDFWVQFLAMRMFWWRIYIDGTTLGSVRLMLRLFRKRWRNMRCVQSNSCSANNFFLLVVHLWNKSHAHLRVNWHEHRRLENLGSADPVPCKLLLVPWRGECTHLRKVLSSPASEGILIGMPLAVPYLVPISMLPDVVEARAAGWTYFQASQRPGQKW